MAHALCGGDQRFDGVIGLGRLRDGSGPRRQLGLGAREERGQVRRRHTALGQPDIHHLLDGPGRFAIAREPDHAARALERVERAAQLRKQVQVRTGSQTAGAHVGSGLQTLQIGAHAG